ncbi:unnamed protein product [Effrenium voratum]|uniref:Uncharacterized protein n=1 Tax=Effrenium voratum TaxID=2562239 RepID=A0AA36IUW3_9DINO|nr:unnamed protein product [Effrenium voratum]
MSDQLWTVSLSFLAYFLVFCFWQRIQLFSRPLMVFFDKLCINQFDPQEKEKGILGLGAFAMRSKQVLVLWSPEYFNRLWCSFEIACFLSPVYKGTVQFLSVKGSCVLFLTSILWHIVMFAFFASFSMMDQFYATGSMNHWIALTTFMASFTIPLLMLVNYLGMSLAQSVMQLPSRLQNFRVQETQCFCCANYHQDPRTSSELPCDRELVYESLTLMYDSTMRGPEATALESFNQRVRVIAADIIGRATVEAPFKQIVSVCVVSLVPYLSELMSTLKNGPKDSLLGFDLAIWCMTRVVVWVQPGLCVLLAHPISIWLWQLHSRPSVLASLWMSPVIVLAVTISWASIYAVDLLTPENSLLPFVPFLVVLALVVLLYSPILRCERSRMKRSDVLAENQDAPPFSTLEVAQDAALEPLEVDEDGDTLVTWAF